MEGGGGGDISTVRFDRQTPSLKTSCLQHISSVKSQACEMLCYLIVKEANRGL